MEKIYKTTYAILFVLSLLISQSSVNKLYAQGYQTQKISVKAENKPIGELLDVISKDNNVKFFYSHQQIDVKKTISIDVKALELEKVLRKIFPDLSITFKFEANRVIVIDKTVATQKLQAKRVYKGQVFDEQKRIIAGATVLIVGTQNGAITTNKGEFELTASPGQEIEVSYAGKVAKKQRLETNTALLTITLKDDALAIDEVQVVAYGTTTKRETTGSMTIIKADEIKGIPSSSISNLLQGRVAGMDVTNISGAPGGGGTQITLRGYNSLNMENGRRFSNPLWVIDGVPMNTFTSPVTGTNGLADLNPDVIETIQILKDASATSLYGSRAANGVILVTTKKGYKNQDAQFSVNVSQTFSVLPQYPVVYGGRGERAHRINAYRNQIAPFMDYDLGIYRYPTSYEDAYLNHATLDGFWGQESSDNGNELQDSTNSFYNNSTDFFKYYFHMGKITNANIQTYGGSEKMTYSIGGGYYGEDGILKGTNFDRINLMGNFSANPVKYLTVDFRTYLSYTDRSRGTNNSSGGSADIETIPGDPLQLSTLLPGNNDVVKRALRSLQSMEEKNNAFRLRSNFGLKLDIMKNLSLSNTVSLEYSQNNRNVFIPAALSEFNRSRSTGQISRDMMLLDELLLNYNLRLKNGHNFDAMLGYSYQYDTYNYNSGSGQNGPSDYVHYVTEHGWPSLIIEDNGLPTVLKEYQSNLTEKKMVSVFGRFNYNYKQKYMATVTLRRDGSSVFGANVRWATFPSYALAWNFSEESFIKSLSFLDFGKVRASYGTSGNQFTNPYLAYGILSGGSVYNGNPTITPDWKSGYYNPDLTWEETNQLDFGVDLTLFKNKLSFTFDYYHRVTDQMLILTDMPGNTSAYRSVWRNGASLLNEGIEFDIKYNIFDTPKAYWNVSLNLAKNWNKFYNSYNNKDLKVQDQTMQGRNYILGKSVGEIYGRRTNGYYQNPNDMTYHWGEDGSYNMNGYPGEVRYVDENGDMSYDYRDAVYLGSTLPKLFGGIVSEARFKNFDLNLLFSYSLGRDMVYIGAAGSVITMTPMNPIFEDLNNVTFWEKEGDNSDYFANRANVSTGIIDKMVQKVNYLKLKSLTIGYTLPQKISKKICLSEVRAFVSGENLFTWTNYKGGLDPETVDINSGLDEGKNYPLARKLTIGLTVKF